MTSTAVILPRCFLADLGFLRIVRQLAQVPPDPMMIATILKIAPQIDPAKFKSRNPTYVPPQWVGYWISGGQPKVTDGAVVTTVPFPGAFAQMIYDLRRLHYGRGNPPPVIAEQCVTPTHMLLHDTHNMRLYVESWEQAEALLSGQHCPILPDGGGPTTHDA